ncbi:MAG: SPOR domain-containing protein [Methylophilaceae bacterium]
MQRDQSDQELNFKKRARRRLVGAIALVLLMIIFLPMVLKDRAANDAQEKIIITLPGDPAATISSDFDSNVVPSPLDDKSSLAESPEDVSRQATESLEDTDIAAKPSATTSNEAIKSKIETANKFYVQIGVFSDPANVKQLQTKLNDLGYKSQTEKVSTVKGEKTRLRTQVFADRNEAAIALENIKDAGLTGMVVSQK